MGKSLTDVLNSLKKEEVTVDWDNVPDERGGWRNTPQPGTYRFQFPAAIDNCFEILTQGKWEGGVQQKDAQGNPVAVERVTMQLKGEYALKIVQSPAGAGRIDHAGEDFEWYCSNKERQRPVGKDLKVAVSDWMYLLRALLPAARPKSNAEWVTIAAQEFPNRQFTANIVWDGFCNPKKDAYFPVATSDEPGAATQYEAIAVSPGSTEKLQGCGHTVYQKDWQKGPNGLYLDRTICPGKDDMPAPAGWKAGEPKCGASLRSFGKLEQFKA